MIIFSINELASQKIDAFSCLHVALLPDAIITADLVHLRKTPLFFEVSLCLSRARLGNMFVFIINAAKSGVSAPGPWSDHVLVLHLLRGMYIRNG